MGNLKIEEKKMFGVIHLIIRLILISIRGITQLKLLKCKYLENHNTYGSKILNTDTILFGKILVKS